MQQTINPHKSNQEGEQEVSIGDNYITVVEEYATAQTGTTIISGPGLDLTPTASQKVKKNKKN